MRPALLLAPIAVLAIAQIAPVGGLPYEPGGGAPLNQGVEAEFPFLQFATPDGGGMTPVCGGVTPTGTKGQALTFSRASSAYCTKGNNPLRTSGIANGDLVSIAANIVRVVQDTSGDAGVLLEPQATNSTYYSEQFDQWLLQNSGVGNPTVTPNYATAPDGTTTAERVQIPATGASGYSLVYRTGTVGACSNAGGSVFGSLYVRGTSGSGSIDLAINNGVSWVSQACAYNATSWTRCWVNPTIAGGSTPQFGFGNGSVFNGNIPRSANDVLVWGAQCETGVLLSSYVGPTTTAAVNRFADAASFPLNFSTASGFSMASNSLFWRFPSGAPSAWGFSPVLYNGVTTTAAAYRRFSNVAISQYQSPGGGPTAIGGVTAYVVGQMYRQAFAMTPPGAATTVESYRDGILTATATGAASAWTGTSLFLNSVTTAASAEVAVISNVCLDPSWKRCR